MADDRGSSSAGVFLAFLSGAAGFWKSRWEGSVDGSLTHDGIFATCSIACRDAIGK